MSFIYGTKEGTRALISLRKKMSHQAGERKQGGYDM
jgi:hypothetical protein